MNNGYAIKARLAALKRQAYSYSGCRCILCSHSTPCRPTADLQGLRLRASSLLDLHSAEQLAREADSDLQELQSLLEVMAETGPKKLAAMSPSTITECLKTMQQLSQLLRDYRIICAQTEDSSRGGVVLSAALERILKGDEGFLLSGLCARSFLDFLAAWRVRFSYLVPQSQFQLIASTFGSHELLEAIAAGSRGAAPTQQHRGILESDGLNSMKLVFEILRGPSYSSVEKSQWLLLLAKASSAFLRKGRAFGGGKTAMQAVMRNLAHSQFDSGGSASAVMQQLLRDADSGEAATAAVSASAILLQSAWDEELAGAVLACLPRAEAGHSFADLAEVYTSCLKSFHLNNAGTSQLLQLLRLPYMPAAVKAKQAGGLVGGILGARVQSVYGPSLAAEMELLRLSRSYGIGLAVGTCEGVLSRCIDTKQLDLITAAMSLFFNERELLTSLPSLSALRGLVTVPNAQPSVFMPLCDPARRGSFSSLLLRIGAAERSPSWAVAAAREAATLDVSVPPDVVSELTEAFLPQHVQHPEFVIAADSGRVNEGIGATILAFSLLLEAQNSTSEPSRGLVPVTAAGARGKLKPYRAKPSASAKEASRKVHKSEGWRSLSQAARSRIARHLLSSSDPDLLRYHPLALGMAPSQKAAAQLLSYQPLPGSAFTPGFISKVLEIASDKANESWRGLGAPALSALRKLPPAEQASELSDGGALALCQLLIRDAIPPDGESPSDGPASLHLLLEFLTLFSCSGSDNSDSLGAPLSAQQLLTPQEWHELVLQLLALGDGQQWDRASPLLTQIMQVLGLAAEARGPGKQLAEKVWIVQQVGGRRACPHACMFACCDSPLWSSNIECCLSQLRGSSLMRGPHMH